MRMLHAKLHKFFIEYTLNNGCKSKNEPKQGPRSACTALVAK